MTNNNELLKHIQAGDKKAFKALFERYSQGMFQYATRFLDEDSAKDIVQDSFYKIWTDKNISIKSSLSGYLFTIVRNFCLQKIEKDNVRQNYSNKKLFEAKKDEILALNTNPLSDMIELELSLKYEKVLEKLPKKCAAVYKMSRFEEKSYQEIAEALDISTKTVEMHISKALDTIRAKLGTDLQN